MTELSAGHDIHVREAVEPDDFAAIAMIRTLESDGYPTSVDDLAHAAARRPREDRYYRYHAWMAERIGTHEPVGTAWLGEEELAPRSDLLFFDIRVPPDLQGQGIGKALYDVILAEARRHGVRYLQTKVWSALERAKRFVAERGFAETWRRIDSELDVAAFDFAPYVQLEPQLAANGLRIHTFADIEHEADCLARLHELDTRLWADIPYGDTVNRPGIEQYRQELVDNPDFLPEGCFVAVDQAGEYVGYSYLTRGETSYNTEMTGVLPAYRGRGVALALKLRGIAYACACGVATLETQNDAVNDAMLGLNRKLGFRQIGATIRYRREL